MDKGAFLTKRQHLILYAYYVKYNLSNINNNEILIIKEFKILS